MTLSEQYQKDGFCVISDPVFPTVVDAAIEGMDAVRAGEYDTGHPPENSRWNPGDDPKALCKIEMPQLASHAIMDLVSHPALGKLAAEATRAPSTTSDRALPDILTTYPNARLFMNRKEYP